MIGKGLEQLVNYTSNVLLFIGIPVPYHLTHPPMDGYIHVVPTTATRTTMTCSLNDTIPASVEVTWFYNDSVIATPEIVTQDGNTTALPLRNLLSSNLVDIYQCVFNDSVNGWTLKRSTVLVIAGNLLYLLSLGYMKSAISKGVYFCIFPLIKKPFTLLVAVSMYYQTQKYLPRHFQWLYIISSMHRAVYSTDNKINVCVAYFTTSTYILKIINLNEVGIDKKY